MAKKATGSMYYGDLIKGAGTVGASMIPTGVDTWTKAMEEIGDAIIDAAERQRLEEEKAKKKREKINADYTASVNDPQMGENFYNATHVVVEGNRESTINAIESEDQSAIGRSAMQINSVNAENKEVKQMIDLHSAAEKNDDRSPNMSDKAKLLLTRMIEGENVRLHLNTKEDGGKYGVAGTYSYVWTIDGQEYTKKDFVANILYNNASSTDWEELKKLYTTRGKDLRDGDSYENEDELLAEIEHSIRYEVLKQNNSEQKTAALRHWLGDENFKVYLKNHPELKNMTLKSITAKGGLKAGPEDGDGTWDTVLSDGDIDMIIEAVTDYDNDLFNEETSSELAIEYMKAEAFGNYVESGNGIVNNHNASQNNTIVGNKFATVKVQPKKGDQSTEYTGYQTSWQYDTDGTRKEVNKNQKIQFDLDMQNKEPAFQSPTGHWLTYDSNTEKYLRWSSKSDMTKWLKWKSDDGDPATEPTSGTGDAIYEGEFTEKQLRRINIGSERTAGGGTAKYD